MQLGAQMHNSERAIEGSFLYSPAFHWVPLVQKPRAGCSGGGGTRGRHLVVFSLKPAPWEVCWFSILSVCWEKRSGYSENFLSRCDLGPWPAPKSFQVVPAALSDALRLLAMSSWFSARVPSVPWALPLVARLSSEDCPTLGGALRIWSGVHSSCTNWEAGGEGCHTFPVQSRFSFQELSCHSKASMQGVRTCTSACWGHWRLSVGLWLPTGVLGKSHVQGLPSSSFDWKSWESGWGGAAVL